MNLNEGRLWNVFHDGSLCHVSGKVPGPLELTIEIKYLRELFLPEGEAFIIYLEHCVLFRFDLYDSEMKDDVDMEILSCRVDADVLKVFCVEDPPVSSHNIPLNELVIADWSHRCKPRPMGGLQDRIGRLDF